MKIINFKLISHLKALQFVCGFWTIRFRLFLNAIDDNKKESIKHWRFIIYMKYRCDYISCKKIVGGSVDRRLS